MEEISRDICQMEKIGGKEMIHQGELNAMQNRKVW